jgi:hypothetical protein
MDSKACTKCEAVKPLGAFVHQRNVCVECDKQRQIDARLKNKTIVRRYERADFTKITEKKCSKCGDVKPLSEFSQSRKNYFRPDCKKCVCERVKEYIKNNPEKYKETYTKHNKTKGASESRKKWLKNNPEKRKFMGREGSKKQYSKKYQHEIERRKRYKENNPDAVKRWNKSYRQKDGYIISLLIQQGFTSSQITPELIELKREQLEMVRLSRQLKKAAKENNAQSN